MTKLSFEIDRELEQRLNSYLVKTYNRTHGYHHIVLNRALVDFLNTQERGSKPKQHEEEIKKNQIKPQAVVFGMPLDGERPTKKPAPAQIKAKTKPKAKKQRFKMSPEAGEKMMELWNEPAQSSMSKSSRMIWISEELGCSRTTVNNYLKSKGLLG